MSLRLATFNIENLLTRFDFTGFRNQTRRDRAIQLFDIRDEATYQALESARMVSSTDDTRQLSALAIADADADILCLQEVDNMAALQAFEYGYLYRMVGNGYLQKYLVEGNDSRGIDVAVVMREETRDGDRIEVVDIKSHAALTYRNLDLFNPALAATNQIDDKIFKRDCLEIDLRIGGKPLTLYVTHFKSMTNARDAVDARQERLLEGSQLMQEGLDVPGFVGVLGDGKEVREIVAGGKTAGHAEEDGGLDGIVAIGVAECHGRNGNLFSHHTVTYVRPA